MPFDTQETVPLRLELLTQGCIGKEEEWEGLDYVQFTFLLGDV